MNCLNRYGNFIRISRKHVVNMCYAELQNDMEIKIKNRLY
jgi:hypothetical protein